MEISAHIHSQGSALEASVRSADATRTLAIPAKREGRGSAVNGGELLMAALATCYCNDLYREAARLGIAIDGCEVTATAAFDGIGQGATRISYSARVDSAASIEQIELLLAETDRLAEIHYTIRCGCPVERIAWGGAPAQAG